LSKEIWGLTYATSTYPSLRALSFDSNNFDQSSDNRSLNDSNSQPAITCSGSPRLAGLARSQRCATSTCREAIVQLVARPSTQRPLPIFTSLHVCANSTTQQLSRSLALAILLPMSFRSILRSLPCRKQQYLNLLSHGYASSSRQRRRPLHPRTVCERQHTPICHFISQMEYT